MKKITFFILAFTIVIATSCKSVKSSGTRHDNGKHKGWYKNPKNPHHPAHGSKKQTPGNSGGAKAKGKK